MLSLIPVLGALDPVALFRALPGSVSQGLIWGIMSIGVYITFKILDFADLTVDGTLATGGAVTAMMILNGYSPVVSLVVAFIAGMAAGFITGVLHTVFGIPDILAGILTQIALYSVNLNITGGKANQAISVDQFPLIVTLREISHTILVTGNHYDCVNRCFILVLWNQRWDLRSVQPDAILICQEHRVSILLSQKLSHLSFQMVW